MSMANTNSVIKAYLGSANAASLIAVVADRIYCPRLPAGAILPAVSFFTRGGTSRAATPNLPQPSVQFDCWAGDPITARNVYGKLYDALQVGLRFIANPIPVVVGANTYYIIGSEEEAPGQDLVDEQIPNYFRVLCFFSIWIKVD